MEMGDLDALTSEQINFTLNLHSANARSKMIQSMREYRMGNMKEAENLLDQAEEDLKVAYDIHLKMIHQETSGNKVQFDLLLMHAEDHLMSTLTMKELVKGFLELFKAKKLD